jgi:hypothetical protein
MSFPTISRTQRRTALTKRMAVTHAKDAAKRIEASLLKNQTRLDPDCEKILRENLWDLYST